VTTAIRQLDSASPATASPQTSRINPRVVTFAAVFLGIFGIPFVLWLFHAVADGRIPFGKYWEVDLKAMSTFDMDQVNATTADIPKQWRDLEGKKVVLTGEMWAPRDNGKGLLTYFQLVDPSKLHFDGPCAPPLAQWFVDCNVVKGAQVEYLEGKVQVSGTIHIRIDKDKRGVIKSIYHVDVVDVKPIN